MLLKLNQVSIQFGGLKVIENLNLQIGQGELVGLIGPNGAGKTTVFNLISGLYQPTAGQIEFSGHNILGLKPFELSRRGVIRTFQNIRLFPNLSVLENILVTMHASCKYSIASAFLQSKNLREGEAEFRKRAHGLLKMFGLESIATSEAGSLPYGLQRKVEILRALAGQPKLLLLDEPAAGLNSSEKIELMKLISRIRQELGLTVLVIEHDMKLVMGICERILVLDHGDKIAEGNAQEIQNNPKVIEAYLGVEDAG